MVLRCFGSVGGMRVSVDAERVRCLCCEMVGTGLMVLVGCGSGLSGSQLGGGPFDETRLLGATAGWAVALVFLIYVFRPRSGAHFNPAVSLALLLKAKIGPGTFLLYVLAQCVGSVLAALLLLYTIPSARDDRLCTTALIPSLSAAQGLVVEGTATFLIVLTVYAVMNDPEHARVAYVVSAVVAGCILYAGPLTAASMNPARSFGPALVHGHWADHWIYWIAPMGAAVFARLAYPLLFPPEHDPDPDPDPDRGPDPPLCDAHAYDAPTLDDIADPLLQPSSPLSHSLKLRPCATLADVRTHTHAHTRELACVGAHDHRNRGPSVGFGYQAMSDGGGETEAVGYRAQSSQSYQPTPQPSWLGRTEPTAEPWSAVRSLTGE